MYPFLACRSRRSHSAFTLVELLVSIGIIALLIGILFPVIASARRQGRDVACMSNMRQIAAALISYAGQNDGSFPPNSGESGQFWYLQPLLGPYLTAPELVGRSGAVPPGADPSAGLAGGVFVCPNDLEDSVRSYSMNFYASGAVSSFAQKKLDAPDPPGRRFKFGARDGSHLLLLLESWPELPIKGTAPTKYVAQAVVGLNGKPGERFGGNRGIGWKTPPDATPGRFEDRDSQITFYRHDPRAGRIAAPRGRCNFAFADGHVEPLRQDQLVVKDRTSSYVALWSPIDRDVEGP